MASGSSSSPFFGIGEEELQHQLKLHRQQQQHRSAVPSSSSGPPPAAPPLKKKRNLPGTPNPDAEVIALSPKTLMATNRFICEVCNKGFQREQNLQLHRRGHNLPWKLRQKSTKEVKKKVYLCPEPTCVHHDPSRALGDLTGIKKHFSRKHGEKKWKCDKCSKRYAVQSDWKAHSKICGTREYRCDCGTLFSRRDSFITHRAFCDALAQETSRLPASHLGPIGSHLFGNGAGTSNMGLALTHHNQVPSFTSSLQDHQTQTLTPSTDLLRLGSQFDHMVRANQPASVFLNGSNNQLDLIQDQDPNYPKTFHGLMHLPDLQPNTSNHPNSNAPNLFNLSFLSNNSSTSSITNNSNNPNPNLSPNPSQNPNMLFHDQFGSTDVQSAMFSLNQMPNPLFQHQVQADAILPQMSATALLQKAAQMGSTSSGPLRPGQQQQMDNEAQFQDLMNSLTNTNAGVFGGGGSGGTDGFGFGGFNQGLSMSMPMVGDAKLHQSFNMNNMGGSDGLTRDFLGVGGMMRGRDLQKHQQQHGIDMGALDPDMKSATNTGSHHRNNNVGRSFAGGGFQ